MGNYDVKQEVTDKYSLRGRVFNKLRDDILSGKYEEHEELKIGRASCRERVFDIV